VSGDRHLLNLGGYQDVSIPSAAQFLEACSPVDKP